MRGRALTRVTREARRGKSSMQPGSERPKRCRHRSATRTSASEKWPVNLPQLGLGLGLDVRQGEVAREPAAVRAAIVRMVVGAVRGLCGAEHHRPPCSPSSRSRLPRCRGTRLWASSSRDSWPRSAWEQRTGLEGGEGARVRRSPQVMLSVDIRDRIRVRARVRVRFRSGARVRVRLRGRVGLGWALGAWYWLQEKGRRAPLTLALPCAYYLLLTPLVLTTGHAWEQSMNGGEHGSPIRHPRRP